MRFLNEAKRISSCGIMERNRTPAKLQRQQLSSLTEFLLNLKWNLSHNYMIGKYIIIGLHGKEGTKVQITKKIWKERGNSYWKNEKISGQKAHTNTRMTNWNVSIITDVFLNQKTVNVCEHMAKTAPRESHMAPSLPCVHIHLPSSDWKRHLWLSKHFN